jgi:hypothetical protein
MSDYAAMPLHDLDAFISTTQDRLMALNTERASLENELRFAQRALNNKVTKPVAR